MQNSAHALGGDGPASSPFDGPRHREALGRIAAVVATGPYEATWESLRAYGHPDWYLDGKFGIFIHWGRCCVTPKGGARVGRDLGRAYLCGHEQAGTHPLPHDELV